LAKPSFLTTKPSERQRTQKSLKRKRAWSIFWGCIIVILTALLFPKNRYTEYTYKINDITRDDVIAPFDFPILKSEAELSKDRNETLKKVPYVFHQNNAIQDNELARLEAFFNDINKVRIARKKYQDSARLLDRYRYSKRYDEILAMNQTDSISFVNQIKELQNKFIFDKNSIVYEELVFNTSNQKDKIQN
jgi:membrane-associated HD superfamily phosphohydrolase